MAVLKGLSDNVKRVKAGITYADDLAEDYANMQCGLDYANNILALLTDAKFVLESLDEEVQNLFYDSTYGSCKGLRVGMGADALKASGIEKVIPNLEKTIKELEAKVKNK